LTQTDASSLGAVNMCGNGKVYSVSNEEFDSINELLTKCGFSLLLSHLARIYTKAVIIGKNYSTSKQKNKIVSPSELLMILHGMA